MPDALLVLNAGSSSIKFSLFAEGAQELQPVFRGQIESLYTAPSFSATDAQGGNVGMHKWEAGTRLGHEGAVSFLVEFLREHRGEYRLAALGHRVVHGGMDFGEAVRVDGQVLE